MMFYFKRSAIRQIICTSRDIEPDVTTSRTKGLSEPRGVIGANVCKWVWNFWLSRGN
jgi:hypothetical protein